MRRALALVGLFCALWFATSANAVVAWNPLTSTTTAQPSVAGGTTVTCTLGSSACPLAGGSIPSGDLIALCIHADSGAATGTVTDTASDTWTPGPSNSNFGNAQTICFWTVTAGLVSTNTIVWTQANSTFATMDLAYLSGATVVSQLDGSNSANYGTNVTTSASGAATGSRNHDAAFGCATNKFGGAAFTQSVGFATPPGQPSGGSTGYICGSAVDAAGSPSAFNYQATSAAQSPTSSALMLFTTEPAPFSLTAATRPLQPGFVSQGSAGCPQAPPAASAAGLCTNTFHISLWSASNPYTVDYGQAYVGAAHLYFGNAFSQGCTPSNTTLGGASVTVGECGGNYQDTLDTFVPGLAGGTNFKGKAFGGGAYFETSCAYTVQNAANGQWEACGWTYSAECMTVTTLPLCQWRGQAAGYEIADEDDITEGFDNNFGAGGNQYCSTTHSHYDPGRGTGSQDLHCFTKTNGFFASQHKYGLLWTPATESVNGSNCYYLDDVQTACTSYPKFSHTVPTNGVISSGSPNFTLSATISSNVVAGFVAYNNTSGANCGTVAALSGLSGTFTGNATCDSSGRTNDSLTFSPCIPPAISSGTYNNGTGVEVLAMASNACLTVGQTVNVSPASSIDVSGNFQTIAGTAGSTVTVQGPAGRGATTITGGSVTPFSLYGAQDDQHLDFLFGCMNGAGACTVPTFNVWQANDDSNIRAN